MQGLTCGWSSGAVRETEGVGLEEYAGSNAKILYTVLRRVAGKARRGPGKVLRDRRWNELSAHVLGPQLQP